MKRVALLIAVVGVTLAVLFWPERGPRITGAAPPQASPRPEPETTPRRVTLPRPELPTRTGSEPEPAPQATPADPAAQQDDSVADAPTRDRPYPLPVPQDMTAVAIDRTVKDLLPDMVACLNAWGAADVTFTGSVALGFDIGPEGLSEVWVEDVEDIPDGPLTCLSGAIWDAAWPPFADDTTVTYPFQVEVSRDTGPAQ